MPFHLMHDNMKLPKGMTDHCLLPSVKTFTTNGDLDLEDLVYLAEGQDHLKRVILKINIRSPQQPDLEVQNQITILILRSLILKIKIMPISGCS